jgi:hypothetical protein
MDIKTKVRDTSAAPAPRLASAGLRYQKTAGGWGVEGFYEGYRLVFYGGPILPAAKGHAVLPLFKKTVPAPKSATGSVNIYSLFSKNARQAWELAYKLCKKRKGQEVGLEDVFLALLKSPSVKNLFSRTKVSTEAAETLLANYLKLTPATSGTVVQKIPFEAFVQALKIHNHKIGSLMLLAAVFRLAPENNILRAIFANVGLNLNKLEILSAWILDLDYDFPEGSNEAKLLFCCRQAQSLEQHLGYFFEFPAIEAAVSFSSKQTLKDLEHKKALQLLVKAAGLAKQKGKKTISKELVRQAAK